MSLKSLVFVLLCTFTLGACKNETGSKDPLSLDDVIDGGKEPVLDSLEERIEEKVLLDETYISFAQQLGENIGQTRTVDSMMFVDRFDTESSYKYQNDSSKIFVAEWKFTSSAAAKNAFMNWIQCFGSKCKSVAIGDSLGISNEKLALLLSGSELYYFSGIKKEFFEKAVTYLIEEKKIENVTFALYQNGRKRMDWMKLEDFIQAP